MLLIFFSINMLLGSSKLLSPYYVSVEWFNLCANFFLDFSMALQSYINYEESWWIDDWLLFIII